MSKPVIILSTDRGNYQLKERLIELDAFEHIREYKVYLAPRFSFEDEAQNLTYTRAMGWCHLSPIEKTPGEMVMLNSHHGGDRDAIIAAALEWAKTDCYIFLTEYDPFTPELLKSPTPAPEYANPD
jgi:hypothetical protein